ncbi:MAG: serine hydrolase [Pseudomonadota bacterium]|nr:serine hydrolase [Pseudomonadota bacterium]
MRSRIVSIRGLTLAVLAVVALGLIVLVPMALRAAGLAASFYAKTLCSGVFVSAREAEPVVTGDILPKLRGLPRLFSHAIEQDPPLARAAFLGVVRRAALYRPGLGCTLLPEGGVAALLEQSPGLPEGERLPPPAIGLQEAPASNSTHDPELLSARISAAFDTPQGSHERRTRAIVVMHKGGIVAERYAEGITPATPLIGWSMGKTVVNALAGMLVHKGRLSLEETSLFPQWSRPGDARAAITPAHLLRMTDGLDFGGERDAVFSPARRMLFETGDAATVALSATPASAPGSQWRYASGPTILLCALAARRAGGGPALLSLVHRELFAPLGMTSAVIEPDAAGTPLGAAFVYASARDWARLGQLFLQDGVWQGNRLLPEGWVAFSHEGTPQSGKHYGAHLWRSTPDFLRPAGSHDVGLPQDRMLMLGIDGQLVAIIPSRDLVIVRLGMSTRRSTFDPDTFLAGILDAFPPAR